jgi:hypothetical protein
MGTTSIYAQLLSDLPSLAAKAFIAQARPKLSSAGFLRRVTFDFFNSIGQEATLTRNQAIVERSF